MECGVCLDIFLEKTSSANQRPESVSQSVWWPLAPLVVFNEANDKLNYLRVINVSSCDCTVANISCLTHSQHCSRYRLWSVFSDVLLTSPTLNTDKPDRHHSLIFVGNKRKTIKSSRLPRNKYTNGINNFQ